MATKSAKSLFGRYLGLDRNNRLWARNGVVTSSLRVGATEGSEVLLDVESQTALEASATATVALATRGITNVSSGASTAYTLAAAAPLSGQAFRKTFVATSSSTLARQILSAVPIIVGASVGGNAGLSSATSAYTVININGQGQVVELLGLSTAYWMALNLNGFATAATPLTTV